MSCSVSLLKTQIPWIAALVPPYLLFAKFSEYGVLSISITFLALIVSTIALIFSKQKLITMKRSVQEQQVAVLNSELEEQTCQVDQIVSDQQPQNVNFGQVEEVLSVQEPEIQKGIAQIQDLYSESESLGRPSSSSSCDDSDIDWPFSGELEQSPLCSDGSISDEESLIEIALPSGHFVSKGKNDTKLKFADLVPESIFQQNCLMDFLADISDVYEEDNLIEIDISMGSIKCSAFEIPA